MSIIYDHAVKYNGRYYPPNTPIEEVTPEKPVDAPLSVQTPDPSSDTPAPEKAQQRKRAPRQKAQKGTGDAE